MMKRWVLAACAATLLMVGPVLANQQYRLYVMCNHSAHAGGRYVRVGGGPYDRMKDCEPDRIAHKSNHGMGKQEFVVQCSWRQTAP
jgi:hypothetical protein